MFYLNLIILLVSSLIGLYINLIISKKFDLFDYPDKKKIHLTKTPNIGGLAIFAYTSRTNYRYKF